MLPNGSSAIELRAPFLPFLAAIKLNSMKFGFARADCGSEILK